MRVLVLEDNKDRRRIFKRSLLGHDGAIVETAQDAIEALEAETWDILFLDHDLADQAYMPSGPGTGYEVAEWLSRNRERLPARVYIHSYNEKGRAKMLEVLPEAVVAKGAWLDLGRYLKEDGLDPEPEE